MSGQTEMYPATTASRPERQLERFGNYWGESLIVNETAIMDDSGALLPRGAIGELVHRGANVMMGYYKDPEATAASRKFGWHHTGDLALIDENGEILFVDRKKDMIKSGGENVASVKIEETLLAHPAVLNAAVVGLPHPQWGEAVSAFVKLKPGATVERSGDIGLLPRAPGGLPGAEARADSRRHAANRDRQAAQGRAAPAIRRHFHRLTIGRTKSRSWPSSKARSRPRAPRFRPIARACSP